jgi:GNAT superfamily N-acetyltransferase
MNPSNVKFHSDAAAVYRKLQPEYLASLVAPPDDMWAAFADMAEPYAVMVEDEAVGFAAVNAERELLAFHVGVPWEHQADDLFQLLVERLGLVAALASTVDPGFLSVSLTAATGPVEVKAILYHHRLEPEGEALMGLRLAMAADHEASVAFAEGAIGAPRSFLEPYLGERIEKGELFLHEAGGVLHATGECRLDSRVRGFAHVGMIVGREQRRQGVGTAMLHALVLESRKRALEPVCSTEPGNLGARRSIHRAGFRPRHRVFRVPLTGDR